MEESNKESSYEKIIFESEDGTEEFFVLEQTMLGGINYILVTDDVDDEEGSFLVLKECQSDEEGFASYEIVEDDQILKSVISVFDELLEDFDLEV